MSTYEASLLADHSVDGSLATADPEFEGLADSPTSKTEHPERTTTPPWGLVARFALCVVVAAVLGGVPSLPSWQAHVCLGVFLLLIFAQLLVPEVEGATLVLMGLALLGITNTLKDASGKGLWAGFGETVTWLVVYAVIISLSVTQTGLGERLAFLLLRRLGHSNLGIAYALTAVEMVLGPVVVSSTARGGGVVAPVVRSVTTVAQHPNNKLYYTMVAYHMNLVSSAAFLTGSSGNTIVRQSARDVLGIDYSWATWTLAQAPPAICVCLALPLLLHILIRPQPLEASEDFRELARQELERIGRWKREELVLVAIFVMLLALWATEDLTGLHTAGIALWGLAVLMGLRILKLEDVLGATKAWSIMLYLGGMLSIVNGLIDLGVVSWFADAMQKVLQGLEGTLAAVVIGVFYFFSMYGFCMCDAHTTALAHVCFQLSKLSGCSPKLIISIIGPLNTLCAALTHYSTGSVLIYFGFGLTSARHWLGVGLAVSVFHLVVWLGVGLLWWKALGWY